MTKHTSSSGINLPFMVGLSKKLGIRGLIASRTIKKHEIIERCPVLLSPIKDDQYLTKTVMNKYYYEWNSRYTAIAIGYGGLINHSFEPNARYCFNYRTRELIFKALRAIDPGEEILINYNYLPNSKEQVRPELVDYNSHDPT